jgi:hypothetical protein
MKSIDEMIESYGRHKNLKIASDELGMNFQTLYWHLKKAGISCSGDKERYGSAKDRFGAAAELEFQKIIPYAEDQNKTRFQPKVDFLVNGVKFEIKSAKRQCLGVGAGGDRWSFSIKKQIEEADFFVLFGFSRSGDVESIFLVPAELIASKTTVSVSCNGSSKWHDYSLSKEGLAAAVREITT